MPRPRPQPQAPELDALLARAEAAWERGEFEAVLEHAEAALRLTADSVEALCLQASAHGELGDLALARDAWLRAVALAPDDLDVSFGAAELLITRSGEEREEITHGLGLAAKAKKRARRQGDEALWMELTLLEGIGLNQLGESRAALQRLDEVLAAAPDAVDARLERGLALFELCRFDEARADLLRVTALEPDDAWAHHYLGLLAERAGDHREAARRFTRATELSPEEFPAPVELSEEEFDQVVEDAVARLPEHVKQYLENTTIAVEPFPAQADLIAEEPPLSPCILGVFSGTPVGQRSVSSAADHATARIILYQRNLERFARGSRAELVDQIGITIMHEVGHLIGLDEEDLWERGLD